MDESLLARHTLRHFTRPNDFTDSAWHSTFEIRFDFIDHQLRILKSDGARRTIQLSPQSVAEFYREVINALSELGIARDHQHHA